MAPVLRVLLRQGRRSFSSRDPTERHGSTSTLSETSSNLYLRKKVRRFRTFPARNFYSRRSLRKKATSFLEEEKRLRRFLITLLDR
ncbi:unnamed protein product, partial [Amoebophrya sp. A25]|eukprot:GSA25T00009156001.1